MSRDARENASRELRRRTWPDEGRGGGPGWRAGEAEVELRSSRGAGPRLLLPRRPALRVLELDVVELLGRLLAAGRR